MDWNLRIRVVKDLVDSGHTFSKSIHNTFCVSLIKSFYFFQKYKIDLPCWCIVVAVVVILVNDYVDTHWSWISSRNRQIYQQRFSQFVFIYGARQIFVLPKNKKWFAFRIVQCVMRVFWHTVLYIQYSTVQCTVVQ